jgi:hypothetical protein
MDTRSDTTNYNSLSISVCVCVCVFIFIGMLHYISKVILHAIYIYYLQMYVCVCVCVYVRMFVGTHGTSRLPLDGFS